MDFLKKPGHNNKVTEIESKISTISSLATAAALTAVKNEVPDVSNLVKKTDYDSKILDIKSKYFITVHCNEFDGKIAPNTKVKQKGLVDKSAIAGLINNAELDRKVTTLAAKSESKAEQEKIKLQAFDSIYFWGKRHFEDDVTQKLFSISVNAQIF